MRLDKKWVNVGMMLLLMVFMASCAESVEMDEVDELMALDEVPCPGDPCVYPVLAPQKVSKSPGARFGKVRTYADGTKRNHNGLDLRMPLGSKLYAMYDSYVYQIGEGNGWGEYIICLTTVRRKPVYIMYAHIQRAKVRVGDFVKTGDVIAISGETGNLDEAVDLGYVEHHMHMEVREVDFNKTYLQSTALDPEEFMSTKLGYTGRPKKKRPCHSR